MEKDAVNLGKTTDVTQVNHEILNTKEKEIQSWRSEKVFDKTDNNG